MQESNVESVLLTQTEAAEFLRLSISGITALRTRGEIPFVRIGSRVYFKKDALIDFINKSETTGE